MKHNRKAINRSVQPSAGQYVDSGVQCQTHPLHCPNQVLLHVSFQLTGQPHLDSLPSAIEFLR